MNTQTTMALPSTINGLNKLPEELKREVFGKIIPRELRQIFQISPDFRDAAGNDLLTIVGEPGSSNTEITLRHQAGFEDPLFYGHITDTLHGQLLVLLYVISDPRGPRYDIDRLPDGTSTELGADGRNIPAELAAMQAGLTPGQVRPGLRLFSKSVTQFEEFISELGHDMYFAQPLYYHNAVILEQIGFSYQQGRMLMQLIEAGFSQDCNLRKRLNGSTPFRMPEAADSIRLRSWAIHDNVLGAPFDLVTMYKHVGKQANVRTCSTCHW